MMARASGSLRKAAARRLWPLLLAVLMVGCANDISKPNKVQRMMLEPARQAEGRGDDVAALRLYLSAARDGLVHAQYMTARFYEQGRGTARNEPEAAAWYQAAADQGHAQAQRNLGRMYESGRGVPQDDGKALALYREAAAAGDASAQYKVGQFIEHGRGTPADPAAAVPFYRAAAQAGEVDAQLALAGLFRSADNNVPEDPTRAAKWYGEAVTQLQAQARRGDLLAVERLADLYLDGTGVPKDAKRAAALYEAAADRGRTGAQVKLARLLQRGQDALAPDPAKAATYFQMAADQGHVGAGYTLAQMYADGAGVAQDGSRAVALYEQSAAQGETRAYAKLGDLYARGGAVRQDHAEAVRWYTLAAQHGDPKGLFKLGEAYERGQGVPADLVQALMWYSLAEQAEYGQASARVERVAAKLAPVDTERAAQLAEAWQQDQG
jgi:TPR repeat protein